MTSDTTTTYILVGLVISWSVLFYFYWRTARRIHDKSAYRAYDLLFLTLIIALIISRGVEVLSNSDYYFRIAGGLQFAAIWDLKLNYLTLLFAPVLAYQFESFNIERNTKWRQSANLFAAFGFLMVVLIEVAQLLRGLVLNWPPNLVVYHALQAGVLFGLALLLIFIRNLPKSIAKPNIILVAATVAVIAINMIYPVLTTQDLNATIISMVVLCLLTIIPFASRQPRALNSRPKPSDFRNL